MTKFIKLNSGPKILVASTILNYSKPDYVYIPLNSTDTIMVKKNENVVIGTPLYKRNNILVTSPISGIVSTVKKMNNFQGETYFLEIANDFKEKKYQDFINRLSINKLNKQQVLDILLPYFDFVKDIDNIDTMILNAVDDEDYVVTETTYMEQYADLFLEILDFLAKTFNIKNIFLGVRSSYGENITNLMNMLGMYPNIKLEIVPDLYLLGQNSFLIEYLNLDKCKTLCVKASEFYDWCNLLKKNKPICDKLVTINGLNVKNPAVIKVKIGTKLNDILKKYFDYDPNSLIFANSLMRGQEIINDDFIITPSIYAILIMPKIAQNKEEKCINCGLCAQVCPKNLKPMLFSNQLYLEKVKNICINCGLCSYICPVYINFQKYFKEEK